jgi:hypothetical protein
LIDVLGLRFLERELAARFDIVATPAFDGWIEGDDDAFSFSADLLDGSHPRHSGLQP